MREEFKNWVFPSREEIAKTFEESFKQVSDLIPETDRNDSIDAAIAAMSTDGIVENSLAITNMKLEPDEIELFRKYTEYCIDILNTLKTPSVA